MRKPLLFMILDGVGVRESHTCNAFFAANKPNLDRLWAEYPHTTVGASGEDVGLPDGQMGNSEVGHLNIGAGRIVYQELTRISKEIREGNFFRNEALEGAVENAKRKEGALHLMGLVSDGGVHSHIDHVKALLRLAKEKELETVYIHCFMDGRDTPPDSGKNYIIELEQAIQEIGVGQIATVSGRYYAMDRDNRWDRIEKAYHCIVDGGGAHFDTAEEAMESSYQSGITDEFVLPCRIGSYDQGMYKDGDSVVYFNFRPDRARELTRALVDPNFGAFQVIQRKVYFVTMTQYDATMPNVRVAFHPVSLENTFGEYISKLGLSQLRIAETEKYAHVTFFFNGGQEKLYPREDRILVKSPAVATYDMKPEMSAYEVTANLLEDLWEHPHDVTILNFANGDMVGHTGVYNAAVEAVEAVDQCVIQIVEQVLEMDGVVMITADHGNCEMMCDPNGAPFTAHTTNRVPFLYIDNRNKDAVLDSDGRLSDFAPTMLHILGLPQPPEMTGKNLVHWKEK